MSITGFSNAVDMRYGPKSSMATRVSTADGVRGLMEMATDHEVVLKIFRHKTCGEILIRASVESVFLGRSLGFVEAINEDWAANGDLDQLWDPLAGGDYELLNLQ